MYKYEFRNIHRKDMATEKQIKFLREILGYWGDTKNLTKDDASKLIDELEEEQELSKIENLTYEDVYGGY